MTNPIDRDPSLEGLLYVPALLQKPLWMRIAMSSKGIVPPLGESAAVRRSDFLVGCVVCLFVAAGIGAFFVGMLWK